LRSIPDCRTRRTFLHLSYNCAPSHSNGIRNTRTEPVQPNEDRSSATTVTAISAVPAHPKKVRTGLANTAVTTCVRRSDHGRAVAFPRKSDRHCLSSADFITNLEESSFRHTHPIDSSIDTHQVQGVRRHPFVRTAAHTTKNRPEVLCPRITQAAMIAAASFGLRRSGRFATATSGAAYGPHQ
jgi:hypothetical protein